VKYGARNRIEAKVQSVASDRIMSLVTFKAKGPVRMSSVLTTDSVKEMKLRKGDRVLLVVKAIHVLAVKE
jgi:molybdopterin-binding protein